MVINLEDLQRRESRGQDFAVAPNGEVFGPRSGGELVNGAGGERPGNRSGSGYLDGVDRVGTISEAKRRNGDGSTEKCMR